MGSAELGWCVCAYAGEHPAEESDAEGADMVGKNKHKIAEYIRHQLDEKKSADRMAMFGKDNAPFQGGREEKARLLRAQLVQKTF